MKKCLNVVESNERGSAMYFTETMFNPEYINTLYFKQQQTQMTQYDFWQDQEVCKAAHAIKELSANERTDVGKDATPSVTIPKPERPSSKMFSARHRQKSRKS